MSERLSLVTVTPRRLVRYPTRASVMETRACHQLAGFGRWAPPAHGIGG